MTKPYATTAWFVVLALFFLVGCAGFTPVPYSERTAMAPVVRWIVADDVHAECLKRGAIALPGHRIVGCAVLTPGVEQCIIVTSNDTTHEVLGHELRHCFEPIWKDHG